MAAAAGTFASAGFTATAAADRDPAGRQYGSAGRAREREGGEGGGSDKGVLLLLPTGFISHCVNSDIIHGDHTEKEEEEEKCTAMLCGSTSSPR